MKICITTYFDKNYSRMGEICLKTLRAYAKKYQFDLKLHNEITSDRPPAWNKILVMKKLLEDPKKYDFILWVDSDALFVRFDKDIRKEIENGKDFYLVKHVITDKEIPNTGVMLLRNCERSRKFLDEVWSKEEYIYHQWWENTAVNELLGYGATIEHNRPKEYIKKILYKLKIKNEATLILSKLGLNKLFSIVLNILKKNNTSLETTGDSWAANNVKWLGQEWNFLPEKKEGNYSIINHYPSMAYDKRIEKMSSDLKKIRI